MRGFLKIVWGAIGVIALIVGLVVSLPPLCDMFSDAPEADRFETTWKESLRKGDQHFRSAHTEIGRLVDSLMGRSDDVSLAQGQAIDAEWRRLAGVLNGFWSPLADCVADGVVSTL